MQSSSHGVGTQIQPGFQANAIAVVIPCYRVTGHILGVVERIGAEVSKIYVVDDKCPDHSGQFVLRECRDSRVVVVFNEVNLGVGGAVMAGYRRAIADGADVIVKIDGDGQMDPAMLARFVMPIIKGQADYSKGNRFYDLSRILQMPKVRLFGNAVLSFMAKLSTGYWGLFDPTNGYTAISARIAAHLPLEKISERYFFETDILFRLNTLRGVVVDIPMHAHYADEKSSLKISRVLAEFVFKHSRNTMKRIFYNYFLRDMNIASFELIVGLLMVGFGLVYGSYHWVESSARSVATPTGIIMLATLPIIVGFQLLLAFLAFDMANVPYRSVSADLPDPLV
jgi:glycosyltransferase involved in cell wall biosynthesis